MGGHGQGLRATAGQVLLQLVADRSITHNLACKPFFSTEKSMQNMRTGLCFFMYDTLFSNGILCLKYVLHSTSSTQHKNFISYTIFKQRNLNDFSIPANNNSTGCV